MDAGMTISLGGGDNAAAWAQAFMSAAAVLVAGLLPWWQRYVESRRRTRAMVELISYSTFPATRLLEYFEGKHQGSVLTASALRHVSNTYDSIGYLDIPSPTLAVQVQTAAASVRTMLLLTETFIAGKETDQRHAAAMVRRQLEVLEQAKKNAVRETKVEPRSVPVFSVGDDPV